MTSRGYAPLGVALKMDTPAFQPSITFTGTLHDPRDFTADAQEVTTTFVATLNY